MTLQDEIVSACERVKLFDRDITQKENSLKELRSERRKLLSKIYRMQKKQELTTLTQECSP